jgi:hypothetical protein
MNKAFCEALGIEWDGKEHIYDGGELFDNYVPYGGGGKGPKNGHYGCKHSDEAKSIMRQKKLGIIPWNKDIKGYTVHTDKSKKQMGEKLSGSKNGRAILDEIVVMKIIEIYISKPILDKVGEIQLNGIPMSYDWAFCNYISEIYGVTPAAIKNLIKKKTWKNVWKKYEVSNKD